ncbi:hypothetical protein PVAND_017257 [Polypedilum vanderplanki]|uniref:Uncharacterized protein n=1 Tax=Polypedilum vanderplanki TaxID=319348 RepID=A0A9J6BI33_POLVA|nr:hypothetical protein PVAND_017257 [Polypedilum vanderplanki]
MIKFWLFWIFLIFTIPFVISNEVIVTIAFNDDYNGVKESSPGEFPFHAAIYRSDHRGLNYTCGASLITEYNLLTAAHCFEYRGFFIESYSAVLGVYDLTDLAEESRVYRKFSSIDIHDEFQLISNDALSNADIAVVTMNKKVKFSDFIKPVKLPSPYMQIIGLIGTIFGYGQTSSGSQHTNKPQKGELKIISSHECQKKGQDYPGILSSRSFCAGDSFATPCQGDSGGGLVIKNDEGEFEIIGIVSHRLSKNECSPNDYAVFVDVSRFTVWIQSKLHPCFSSPCGQNGKCINIDDRVTCVCHDDFIGIYPNCEKIECWKVTDCADDRACLNNKCFDLCALENCGPNSVCLMEDHKKICECQLNFKLEKNQCTLKSNLLDGSLFSFNIPKNCNFGECGSLNYLTFFVSSNTKILITDAEVMSKHQNDKIDGFRIYCDDCDKKGKQDIFHLPINVIKIFPNLLAYFAHHTKVKKLTRENFKEMKKLDQLNLHTNEIEEIDDDAFDDLIKLEYLNLSENNLKILNPRIFLALRNLKYFHVSKNQLTSLTAHVFENLVNLKHFILNENYIKSFPSGIFDRLTNLSIIDTHNNQFTTFDENIFKNNFKLEGIYLWNNKITKLSYKLFENKEFLKRVDLSRNICINLLLYVNNDKGEHINLPEEKRNELKNLLIGKCS